MSELNRYHYYKISNTSKKIFEDLLDRSTISPDERIKKIKIQNKKVGRKYAKNIGLSPDENLEKKIRTMLNEKIIFEVKRRKIKHYEIAHSIGASRSKITCIMNRKIDGITIDFMMRIISILGIPLRVSFT